MQTESEDALNRALIQFQERLRIQDTAGTMHPIFIVQQWQRDYGYDPAYGSDTVWLDEDGRECDLDEDAFVEGTKGFTQTGYVDRWKYVSAHFTRAAAERYIGENAHRMDKARVFVESQYRCHEWNAIIEILRQSVLRTD